MATQTERLAALSTAAFNRQLTNAEWLRVATAAAYKAELDHTSMTQAQLSQMLLKMTQQFLVDMVREYEGLQAASQAAIDAKADVDADYQEAP